MILHDYIVLIYIYIHLYIHPSISAVSFSSVQLQVFMYDTGTGWLPSDIYTWPDMIEAVNQEPSEIRSILGDQ